MRATRNIIALIIGLLLGMFLTVTASNAGEPTTSYTSPPPGIPTTPYTPIGAPTTPFTIAGAPTTPYTRSTDHPVNHGRSTDYSLLKAGDPTTP